jgi:hypothetical protein
MNPLKSLIRSRKFLLAVFGVIQTVVFHYFGVDPEVWVSIDALVMVVIYGIATEDAAEKTNRPPASE